MKRPRRPKPAELSQPPALHSPQQELPVPPPASGVRSGSAVVDGLIRSGWLDLLHPEPLVIDPADRLTTLPLVPWESPLLHQDDQR
jgi:hypothetical protein